MSMFGIFFPFLQISSVSPCFVQGYRVWNVTIDVPQGSKARSEAIDMAYQVAFEELCDATSNIALHPDSNILKRLVRSLVIRDEAITKNTYQATFDITFSPEVEIWLNPPKSPPHNTHLEQDMTQSSLIKDLFTTEEAQDTIPKILHQNDLQLLKKADSVNIETQANP